MNNWKYKIIIDTQKRIEGTNQFESSGDLITVESPITCKGTVSMGFWSETNSATFTLYNLSLATRSGIYQDYYDKKDNILKNLKFMVAKDGQNYTTVFTGVIVEAFSEKKSGQVDIITHISCITMVAPAYDNYGMSTARTFAAGISKRDAVKILVDDMPGVTLGNLGNLQGNFLTNTTFEGNTFEQIQKICGGNATIENGVLNIILSNECIKPAIPVIANDTILLDTPKRRYANLEINFLMMPEIVVNQLMEVKSGIFPDFNGQYKVLGYTHDFIFSPVEAGQRTTQANLLNTDMVMMPDKSITAGVQKDNNGNYSTPIDTKRVAVEVRGENMGYIGENTASDVYSVYKYIQEHDGAIPKTKITANISWAEMLENDNTPQQRKSQVTVNVLSNCVAIAKALQKIIDVYYKGKTITINSGWRSVENNRACGGAAKSKHLLGLAIDFSVSGVSAYNLDALLQRVWNGKRGYTYRGGNWVHIQLDNLKGLANDR